MIIGDLSWLLDQGTTFFVAVLEQLRAVIGV